MDLRWAVLPNAGMGQYRDVKINDLFYNFSLHESLVSVPGVVRGATGIDDKRFVAYLGPEHLQLLTPLAAVRSAQDAAWLLDMVKRTSGIPAIGRVRDDVSLVKILNPLQESSRYREPVAFRGQYLFTQQNLGVLHLYQVELDDKHFTDFTRDDDFLDNRDELMIILQQLTLDTACKSLNDLDWN